MKSRLLCMCTCLALAVSGLTAARAERPDFQTITQLRETCPDSWCETLHACGREIIIDLDVAVPEVERFPVMEADPVPLADGRSAEASVVIGDTEQWMSTGILRIDSPNRQIKNAAQKMHPAPAVPQGYNQYPILRQFGEFDPDTAYAFNNPTTVTDAQALLLRAWENLYPGEDIALLPHRLVAYQGEMKYDYRTDTYSGDPLPESEATLMVYFDQTVGGDSRHLRRSGKLHAVCGHEQPGGVPVSRRHRHHAGAEKHRAERDIQEPSVPSAQPCRASR